ncbi:MAG: TetR/AcrR family transcriptional regulator [Eubacterium sp.]|nr:TetR/AcrR family transcriptional regulator [Eubacterium sp.]
MENHSYHHGDLKRELMEKGLVLINKYGEDNLSLRKLASECGVSNAAPYAHFKNKEELISEIQNYVMGLFTAQLEKAVSKYSESRDIFIMLGKAYVMFFYNHPSYFNFLFSRKNIKVNISIDDTGENPPFDILKNTALKYFSKLNMPECEIENTVVAMWALVHGLSAITAMPNVVSHEDWEKRVEAVLRTAGFSKKEN